MKVLKTLAITLAAALSLNCVADEVEFLNITLKNGKTVACKVSDIENIAFDDASQVTYEYIDLGLPSGLQWATCNIGAQSPTECGEYFAYGMVEPLTDYTAANYPHWGLSESELKSMGIIDNNGLLTAEYDAATFNWGDNWRMPSYQEFVELRNSCEWDETTIDGVSGYQITGPNGNSIFLPYSGFMEETTLNFADEMGCYWTSYADYDADGYYLRLSISGYTFNYQSRKYVGYTIRPVYDDPSRERED